MCNFFSIVSDGAGKPYYFDYNIRKKIIARELNYETDSHTSIAEYYGFKGRDEDMLNKYEFNPLTKKFEIDGMPNKDDSLAIKEFCLNLDFKKIVPELIIKPIIHPFRDVQAGAITEREIELLKQWDSVWASVGAYFSSFFNLSEWKHIKHEQGKNPFQSGIDLWESGFVPSYDGKIWRLHADKDANIVYELRG